MKEHVRVFIFYLLLGLLPKDGKMIGGYSKLRIVRTFHRSKIRALYPWILPWTYMKATIWRTVDIAIHRIKSKVL